MDSHPEAIDALIVALPESAGSAIYGLVDVFASTGLQRELIGDEPGRRLLRPESSRCQAPFRCGNGIPGAPTSPSRQVRCRFVVVPELWLAANDDPETDTTI